MTTAAIRPRSSFTACAGGQLEMRREAKPNRLPADIVGLFPEPSFALATHQRGVRVGGSHRRCGLCGNPLRQSFRQHPFAMIPVSFRPNSLARAQRAPLKLRQPNRKPSLNSPVQARLLRLPSTRRHLVAFDAKRSVHDGRMHCSLRGIPHRFLSLSRTATGLTMAGPVAS